MSHIRKQIRDEIVTTLTGLTTTGSRVYQTRLYPLEQTKLPGLCIYTKSESIEYSTIRYPRRQNRTLNVIVEAYVAATSNLDNTLDTISKEVEEALYADLTRGGYAKDTSVVLFEAEYDVSGEQPVGIGRLSIEVSYTNMEDDVETSA